MKGMLAVLVGTVLLAGGVQLWQRVQPLHATVSTVPVSCQHPPGDAHADCIIDGPARTTFRVTEYLGVEVRFNRSVRGHVVALGLRVDTPLPGASAAAVATLLHLQGNGTTTRTPVYPACMFAMMGSGLHARFLVTVDSRVVGMTPHITVRGLVPDNGTPTCPR